MTRGGNRLSREAIVAAHERERQSVQLFIRGLDSLTLSAFGIFQIDVR
jgi:hypothetical protein